MARLSGVLLGQDEKQGCPNCCSSMKTQLGLQTLWELGKGGQGIVFLCIDQACGTPLACKTIRSHARPNPSSQVLQSKKRKLKPMDSTDDVHYPLLSSRGKLCAEEVCEDTQIRWEAEVLHRLRGIPGVLPLISTFEGDDSCFHLVTAFCDAGDLLSKLDAHPPLFKLSEHLAAPIVASLTRTLASCHARGIIHRDIKPGNILFRKVEGKDQEEVVIADFGLAATVTPGESLCERVGTSRYQAPEVIQAQYDHRADIWSLGIIIYLLLTSTLPFIEHLNHGAPDSAIQQAILSNDLKLEGFDLSYLAQDLLRRILCKDPSARLTLEEVLCHPWLLQNMEPISVAPTQAATIAPLTDLLSSPSKHRSQCTVGGVDKAGFNVQIPKSRRVGQPMGRKCFRQLWGNAVAKAAIA